MLVLKDIVKNYVAGSNVVKALKGITLNFRQNEFVSILGPSGCGKTTLLNIIGGLDHYTSGDLVINGISTKLYKDSDWDLYRNHRIGFIFQSYNLIPHQTVLGNVELALTIAGLSKEERIKKAKIALDRVGLSDQYYKKPNQLSGGQCQRVAIARALVNDPEILLADEPTGALDSETSLQIMDLIKEISNERLVIMVTHNPDLAYKYSTRIIKLLDGLVVEDSNPCTEEELKNIENEGAIQQEIQVKKKNKKAKMSFITAFKLSAKNLISKKGRTALVGFAGSIGIIGISLVLAFSAGIKGYVVSMQDDMLSGNPITITEQAYDLDAFSKMMNATQKKDVIIEPNRVNVDSMIEYIAKMTDSVNTLITKNDIKEEYVNYVLDMPKDYYSAMKVGYGINLNNNIFTQVKEVDYSTTKKETGISITALTSVYTSVLKETPYSDYAEFVKTLVPSFEQAPNSKDYIASQYEVHGEIATKKNQIMLVLDKNSALTDVLLARLGYYTQEEFLNLVYKVSNDEDRYNEALFKEYFTYDELKSKKFTYYANDSVFNFNQMGIGYNAYEDKITNFEDKLDLEVSGILIPKESISYGCLRSGVYYTSELTDYVLEVNKDSEIVGQIKDSGSNRITAIPYTYTYYYLDETKMGYDIVGEINPDLMSMGNFGSSSGGSGIPTTDYYVLTLRSVGGDNIANSLTIYPVNFDNKYLVTDYLDKWNEEGETITVNGQIISSENRANVTYTDSLELIISLINTMIDIISYALIAFTSVSLVVSTVMIGIITYVSVVERIKEIGVIRSLGGRKKDVSYLFIAETFIIGMLAGLIGVLATYLVSAIINAILYPLIGIKTLASLPILEAGLMLLLSVGLTLISGLLPARSAANKDPVIALRTE